MEQIPLTAQKRTVLGRKVKTLRREGQIPAHVFGHKVKTIHVQVNSKDFHKVFEKAGETGIIDLTLDKEKKPVLVRSVQVNPVTDEPLHIDFYQVNLSEKVKVNVPIEIVGEAQAVEKKIGLLLTPISEIEIEALPVDLPESIEVDVSILTEIGQEIKVKDLNIDRSKIEVHTDPEQIVAQIGELVTKEMEALEAEVEAEQAEAEAAAETEGAEAKEAEAAEGEEGGAEEGEKEEGKEEKTETGEGDSKEDKKE